MHPHVFLYGATWKSLKKSPHRFGSQISVWSDWIQSAPSNPSSTTFIQLHVHRVWSIFTHEYSSARLRYKTWNRQTETWSQNFRFSNPKMMEHETVTCVSYPDIH